MNQLRTSVYPGFPQVSAQPYQFMVRDSDVPARWGTAAIGLFVDVPCARQQLACAWLQPDIASFAFANDDTFLFWERMSPEGKYMYGFEATPGFNPHNPPPDYKWYMPTITALHYHEFELFYAWMQSLKTQGAPIPSVHGLALSSRSAAQRELEWLVWKLPNHPRTQGVSIDRVRQLNFANAE